MSPQKSGLRLHQVLLSVKSIDRSLAFYTEKLGFKLQYDFSPEYAVVLTPNKVQIGMMPDRAGNGRKMPRGQRVALEFMVDNVDRWYRKLRGRGIRFSEAPKDRPGENEKLASKTLMAMVLSYQARQRSHSCFRKVSSKQPRIIPHWSRKN